MPSQRFHTPDPERPFRRGLRTSRKNAWISIVMSPLIVACRLNKTEHWWQVLAAFAGVAGIFLISLCVLR